jgi:hypothetical protein
MRPAVSQDLTSFVTAAARTNDPTVVAAFGERFPRSQLHLPLTTLDGVKNRPDIALELGARLPAHRLRLDNGRSGVALFTSLPLCRDCARKLSWKTDGKPIKTLLVPGPIALTYLRELLMTSEVDRAIVNPLSDAALHLARTDVDAMADSRPIRSLWFYDRDGSLKLPVEVGGASLLSAVFDMAGRALRGEGDVRVESGPGFESLPPSGPLPALASELYDLLSREGARDLEVTLTLSGGELRVETDPRVTGELPSRIETVARRHLRDGSGETKVTLRLQGSSVVVSASSEAALTTPKEARPKARRLEYIPLEPEEDS